MSDENDSLEVLRDVKIGDTDRRLLRLAQQLNRIHFSHDEADGLNPVAVAAISEAGSFLEIELPCGAGFVVWAENDDDSPDIEKLTAQDCLEMIRGEMEEFVTRYAPYPAK